MTKSRHRAIDSAYMMELRERIGDLVTLSNSSEAEFLAQDVFDSVEALGVELSDNIKAQTSLVDLMMSVRGLLGAFIISATDAAVAAEDEFDERAEQMRKSAARKAADKSAEIRKVRDWHSHAIALAAVHLSKVPEKGTTAPKLAQDILLDWKTDDKCPVGSAQMIRFLNEARKDGALFEYASRFK